jgi:hypothetical protein
VSGTPQMYMTVEAPSTGFAPVLTFSNLTGAGTTSFDTASYAALGYWTDNIAQGERFTSQASNVVATLGTVGVGTITPNTAYKLDVNGAVSINSNLNVLGATALSNTTVAGTLATGAINASNGLTAYGTITLCNATVYGPFGASNAANFAGTVSVLGKTTLLSTLVQSNVGGFLASTAGSSNVGASFYLGSNNNASTLKLFDYRICNGSSWQMSSTRLQRYTDVSPQAYIDLGMSNDAGLAFGSGTSQWMCLTTSGNLGPIPGSLGIGTSNPQQLLDVAGSARVSNALLLGVGGNAGNASNWPGVIVSATGAQNAVVVGDVSGKSGFTLGLDQSDSKFKIQMGGGLASGNFTSPSMTFANSGSNVGILTTAPAYTLDVNGSFRSLSTGNSTAVIRSTGWPNGSTLNVSDASNAASNLAINYYFNLVPGGYSASLVSGQAGTDAAILLGGTNSNSGLVIQNVVSGVAGSGARFGVLTAEIYAFSGVGINTSTPQYTLDVNGTLNVSGSARFTNPAVLNNQTSTNANQILFTSASNNTYAVQQIDNAGANRLRFGRNGFDDIAVSSVGYVGINNNSPAYALDVTGSINLTGTLVRTVPMTARYASSTLSVSNNVNTVVTFDTADAINVGAGSALTYSAGVFTNNTGRTATFSVAFSLQWSSASGAGQRTAAISVTPNSSTGSIGALYAQSTIPAASSTTVVNAGTGFVTLASSGSFFIVAYQNCGVALGTVTGTSGAAGSNNTGVSVQAVLI